VRFARAEHLCVKCILTRKLRPWSHFTQCWRPVSAHASSARDAYAAASASSWPIVACLGQFFVLFLTIRRGLQSVNRLRPCCWQGDRVPARRWLRQSAHIRAIAADGRSMVHIHRSGSGSVSRPDWLTTHLAVFCGSPDVFTPRIHYTRFPGCNFP